MKRYIKFFTLFFLLSNPNFSQPNWDLENDHANFAFFVVDYSTYNFEGGYFNKFPYQPGYDSTSIPFTITYHSPSDFGDILFTYSATNDTIFAATILWRGIGKITFPDTINPASEFTYDSTLNITPLSVSYINYVSFEDTSFIPRADSAWAAVNKLSILKEFGKEGNTFRIALYLYAPAVGGFDLGKAKWIVFLYRGQSIVSVENSKTVPGGYKLFQNFPNPFNPMTNIEFIIPTSQNVRLIIYNILGLKKEELLNSYLRAGKHRIVFNGTEYASGIYFYQLITSSYNETKKLLLLK